MPFSAEFLISAAAVDFVDRARGVRALAPGRQVGLQASGSVAGGRFTYALGAFNGNSGIDANDDGKFLFAGRLTTSHGVGNSLPSDSITLGASAAFSDDTAATVGAVGGAFAGKRLLVGGDLRVEYSGWMLSSEVVWGKLEPAGGAEATVLGYHASAGYAFHRRLQLLARWDVYDPGDLGPEERRVIASLAFDAPRPIPAYFTLEYQVELEADPTPHRVIVGWDVAF